MLNRPNSQLLRPRDFMPKKISQIDCLAVRCYFLLEKSVNLGRVNFPEGNTVWFRILFIQILPREVAVIEIAACNDPTQRQQNSIIQKTVQSQTDQKRTQSNATSGYSQFFLITFRWHFLLFDSLSEKSVLKFDQSNFFLCFYGFHYVSTGHVARLVPPLPNMLPILEKKLLW